jgi:hypothetical protein
VIVNGLKSTKGSYSFAVIFNSDLFDTGRVLAYCNRLSKLKYSSSVSVFQRVLRTLTWDLSSGVLGSRDVFI